MQTTEKLGRFDHHPNPAIDFCTEVDAIEGMLCELGNGVRTDRAEVNRRIDLAMTFRVGGDEGAVAAMGKLRLIAATLDGDFNARSR